MDENKYIALENKYLATNYGPYEVVLSKGDGVWLWDTNGDKYLDFLSAYSAVSAGHSNKRIQKAMIDQITKLGVTSRVYHSDTLGAFAEKVCKVTGMERVLPMNTGAEAVESAIKAVRRWGYDKKGIADNKAEIIVNDGNFHGRTTTIVGFSSEPEYTRGFGPFAPGFKSIPFGDLDALEAAITENTCAFLTEPMQGERGIIVPPKGWLKKAQEICRKHNVLLICDEIQTGIGRTGKNFAFQHELDGVPDGLLLGKALGGGLYPVSAFLASEEVMSVFDPGSHGSTFGGNSIAGAIGLESLNILEDENLAERSAEMGEYLMDCLRKLESPLIREVRGAGLWVGVDFDPEKIDAKTVCKKLIDHKLLSKETHHTVIRFAPPLIITKEEIDWALDKIEIVLRECEALSQAA